MITFLFGAGASFGSGECIPNCPPQGKQLFDELEKIKGSFHSIEDSVKDIFRRDGFEAGMALIPNDSKNINPLLREMALYLSRFHSTKNNAYYLLFRELKKKLKDITIATLNYDLLIERSLVLCGINPTWSDGVEGVKVLKVHGSCNFLPQLPRGVAFGGSAYNCDVFIEGLQTHALITQEKIENWFKDGDNFSLAPAIAMYEAKKRVVISRSIVDVIQRDYQSAIRKSNLVVVVGANYVPHDKHVWECMEKSNCSVFVVDPYPSKEMKEWLEIFKRNKYKVIRKGFHDSVYDIVDNVNGIRLRK